MSLSVATWAITWDHCRSRGRQPPTWIQFHFLCPWWNFFLPVSLTLIGNKENQPPWIWPGWVVAFGRYWEMDGVHFGLALCPGTWPLIGFQQPNWFSVLKPLPFTLGNEVSKLQRQKARRSPNACSWICASSPTSFYWGINFWCAPLNRENA